ncbi:DNA-directed RNA polymerase subunit K [Candidatus Woesearchaeota archaeon]|nr:DNA-directed RNA polymerase subunit K [Candidatus Woesearchaeota archaeon]
MKHTKYEIARIIGSRALQIASGAPFLIKITKEELEAIGFNPIKIAMKEYEKEVLPISIKHE